MDCKEDVLDRVSFVKQIIDLTMIVSENRKTVVLPLRENGEAAKVLYWKRYKSVLIKKKQKEGIAFLLFEYDCWEYDLL